jgi:enoyl-CoA hydratase/carnithine racemase
MDASGVELRQSDGVAQITLRRPDRLNALSSDVAAALQDAVAAVAGDDQVRAIVVAGEGKAFCAGADIRELGGLDGPHGFSQFVRRLTDAFDALERCSKPSVAAIHGVAFGGGLELALACDLRVAAEGARLGVPEVKLGLLPGAGGTARLPRLLPKAVAKQLLLTGEPMSAEDAYRLGLVNSVVPEAEVVDAAGALAAQLAGLAPLALAAAKRLVDAGPALSFDAALAFERETVSMLFGTDDRVEGVAAFLEKRSAEFGGH